MFSAVSTEPVAIIYPVNGFHNYLKQVLQHKLMGIVTSLRTVIVDS